MKEEEALDKTLSLLDDKSISVSMIEKYGVQAPVNPLVFKNVNKEHVICISEELLEGLYNIHHSTKETGNEVPFFLFGYEREDGSVFFDKLEAGKADRIQDADFKSISSKLLRFINFVGENKLDNQIVCHGHTHGKHGDYPDNFSLKDMSAYVEMSDIHPLMKNGTIQTIGCVFNSSGDLNFVLYDKYNQGFYKFPNVVIEFNDGSKEPLPAYCKGKYKSDGR